MPRWLSATIDWFAILVALLWLTGCSSPPVTRGEVAADTLSWNANIAAGRAAWLEEARRRFPHPFVFVCHGDSTDRREWRAAPDKKFIQTDVEAVGWLLHSLMPDRDVVLVMCNAEGIKPRLPRRVWYSPHGIVWSVPGDDWRLCDWGVGSVWGMVEGTERE